jgi:iron complex outermembrane receptor protein
MVNLALAYDTTLAGTDYSIYMRATNLFDVRAYNHASYISTVAPLPGRRVMLGVRAEF